MEGTVWQLDSHTGRGRGLLARWRMTEVCWVRDDGSAEWSQRPTIVCLPTCLLLLGLVYMCPLPRTLRHVCCCLLPLLLETSSHSSFKTGSVLPGHLVPWAWTGACSDIDGWLLPDVRSALG